MNIRNNKIQQRFQQLWVLQALWNQSGQITKQTKQFLGKGHVQLSPGYTYASLGHYSFSTFDEANFLQNTFTDYERTRKIHQKTIWKHPTYLEIKQHTSETK